MLAIAKLSARPEQIASDRGSLLDNAFRRWGAERYRADGFGEVISDGVHKSNPKR